MTPSDLQRLPEILRPCQVRELTGLSDESMTALRLDHPEIVVRKCGRGRQGRWLYSKEKLFLVLRLTTTAPAPEIQNLKSKI